MRNRIWIKKDIYKLLVVYVLLLTGYHSMLIQETDTSGGAFNYLREAQIESNTFQKEISRGNIIIVDDDGGQDYLTIQSAIDNATPGDTVRVWAGRYYENININKPLTISGNGSTNTTIDGSSNSNVICINYSWVKMSGLNITNASSGGIFINNANHCIIMNNTVSNLLGAVSSGIILTNANNCTIKNNTCNQNGQSGILLYDSNKNLIINNTACRNRGDGAIVLADWCCHNTVSNNNCSNNFWNGMYINNGCEYNIITQNTIDSNLYEGIWFELVTYNIVTNNTCNNNNRNGLRFTDGCHHNIVANNTIFRNNNNGIWVWVMIAECNYNTFSNNMCIQNNGNGLYLEGGTGMDDFSACNYNVIKNNIFRENIDSGLNIRASRHNFITNNTCNLNQNHGISLYGTLSADSNNNNNTIINNNCSKNRVCGIHLDNTDFIKILNNTVSENVNYGITIVDSGSENCKIYSNDFLHNNNENVQAIDNGSDNNWHNSINTGNYWSDYISRYHDANNDGNVWNTPYNVDGGAGSIDQYPLVSPTRDNEPPFLIRDNTSNFGATGDPLNIVVTVDDSYGIVNNVFVNWSHGVLADNQSLLNVHGQTWSGNITVDHNLNDLIYRIIIFDNSKNCKTYQEQIVNVIDNDPPELINDETSDSPRTGSEFELLANVSDNIAIRSVEVSYYFDGAQENCSVMENLSENDFRHLIHIPLNSTRLQYFYFLNDTSGNTRKTPTFTINNVSDIISPLANAGDDIEIDQHQQVRFSGFESTDNIGIVDYTWNFSYNGTEKIIGSMNHSFYFDNAGEYKIHLNVTDAAGNWAVDSIAVMVNDTSPPLLDIAEEISVDQYENVTFNASECRDNVEIAHYNWSFSYNGTNNNYTGSIIHFQFDIAGQYIVKLNVSDQAGNWAVGMITVTVLDITPPIAIAIPAQISTRINETVYFNGSYSWDNVGIVNYSWNFTYAGTDVRLHGPLTNFTFHISGKYNVTLKVKDEVGHQGIASIQVNVTADENQTAFMAVITVEKTEISTGDTLLLEGKKSSASQGIANWTWNILGPSTNVSLYGEKTNFTFTAKGTYYVTLTITDNAGFRVSAVQQIEVISQEIEKDGSERPSSYSNIYIISAIIMVVIIGIVAILTVVIKRRRKENADDKTDSVEPPDAERPLTTTTAPSYLTKLTTPKYDAPSPFVTNIIPGYTMTYKIGAGGFATVYKAKSSGGREVAIKLPKALNETVSSSVLEKFKQESDMWKKLKHENIVQFYGGDIRPCPYIVMELLEGGTLRDLMKKHTFSIEEAVHIMQNVFKGISHAHRMASIHRDIKPDNILFTKDGIPKITDWGIGKFMASDVASESVDLKGTIIYSAPEQISKDRFGAIDWQTDIFQLGIVFYEILTGENPFTDDDPLGVINNITVKIPRPPSQINPSVPEFLDRFILRSLEKNKADRWRSADVMYQYLEENIEKNQLSLFPQHNLPPVATIQQLPLQTSSFEQINEMFSMIQNEQLTQPYLATQTINFPMMDNTSQGIPDSSIITTPIDQMPIKDIDILPPGSEAILPPVTPPSISDPMLPPPPND